MVFPSLGSLAPENILCSPVQARLLKQGYDVLSSHDHPIARKKTDWLSLAIASLRYQQSCRDYRGIWLKRFLPRQQISPGDLVFRRLWLLGDMIQDEPTYDEITVSRFPWGFLG
jgi:hypothetical protein